LTAPDDPLLGNIGGAEIQFDQSDDHDNNHSNNNNATFQDLPPAGLDDIQDFDTLPNIGDLNNSHYSLLEKRRTVLMSLSKVSLKNKSKKFSMTTSMMNSTMMNFQCLLNVPMMV
jgi:hypothetical protein